MPHSPLLSLLVHLLLKTTQTVTRILAETAQVQESLTTVALVEYTSEEKTEDNRSFQIVSKQLNFVVITTNLGRRWDIEYHCAAKKLQGFSWGLI
jgi:hypothetical protein